ncbi:MAG: type II toxin-antitoxin system Phd/YefM family antitoxin [Candidatus Binatia bacterium]
MKTMPTREFKVQCLRVIAEVRTRRESVLITEQGVAVAQLVPADNPAVEVFGCMSGTAEITGDIEAPVISASLWQATSR